MCSNMDGHIDCHTKWSKSDRERQILYDITFMQNLKEEKYEFIKQKQTYSLREWTYYYQGRRTEGEE